ncbi:MAG: hypothetical protein HY376_03760 [Candidatus Blackburnbacteria bacterium]|nr:hypothetical protein [Candidatus Blackburnbacteria bacterium]
MPAVTYAALNAGESDGGAPVQEEPAPEQAAPEPEQETALPEEPQATYENYVEETPPAETNQAEIPQEETLAEAPAPVEEDTSGTPSPAEAEQTQMGREAQEVAETPASTEVPDTFAEGVLKNPIIDPESQEQTIDDYVNAANEAAQAEDPANQEARQDREDLTPIDQAIAIVEETPAVIFQIAEDFAIGSLDTAADLADGIDEIGQNSYNNQIVKSEEEYAQETAQAEAERQKTLDDYLALSPQERAQQAAKLFGLPPDTPPSDIVREIDKLSPGGGIELQGDIDNLTITQKPEIKAEDYLRPDQIVISSTVASLLTAGMSDIVAQGIDALNNDLPKLEKLREASGFDPVSWTDINYARKLADLTPDELDLLNQGEIVNGLLATSNPEQMRAKYEYAIALKEWHQKSESMQEDAKIAGALAIIGGGAIDEGILKAAGKAIKPIAKPLLRRADEAFRSLAGGLAGLFRKAETETAEAGIQTALAQAEPVFAQTIKENAQHTDFSDIRYAIGTRQQEGYSPLTPLEEIPPDIVERAEFLQRYLFGEFNSEPVTAKGEKQVLAEWLKAGKTEDEITTAFSRALSAYDEWAAAVSNRASSTITVSPETQQVLNAQTYNSRLRYKFVLDKDRQVLDMTDALLVKEASVSHLDPRLKDTADSLAALANYAIDNGADTASFKGVSGATNPENIHLVPPAKMERLRSSSSTPAGLYIPNDKQLLIRSDYNLNAVVMHECIHSSCRTSNPKLYNANFLEQMGGSENIIKLEEGLTEWATIKGHQLADKTTEYKTYESQVNAVEKVIQKMQQGNLFKPGLPRKKAEAAVIEAALSGYYGKLYEPLGKGDINKGQQILRSILDETPTTTTNVIDVPDKTSLLTQLKKEYAAQAAEGALAGMGLGTVIERTRDRQIPFNINLIKEVYAQTEAKPQNVNISETFKILTKINLVKGALNEGSDIDNDFLKDVSRVDIIDPSVTQTGSAYIFQTGQNGIAEGQVEPNEYKITVPSYENIGLSTPSTISIKDGKYILPIGIKEGKTNENTAARNKSALLRIKAYAENNSPKPISIVTYYDENSNGKWDSNEHAVPWAGVEVALTKINKNKLISFNQGWNLFTLTAVPSKPLTASGLIQEIAKQGGYATTVSALDNGSWKSYVVRGDSDFSGEDFAIEPGRAYFVKTHKKSLLIFEGQEFVAPLKTTLTPGWNAVGFPKSDKSHTAADLTVGDATMARWKSGLWDTFVKQSKEQYGENFSIEPNRGYIIKVTNPVQIN